LIERFHSGSKAGYTLKGTPWLPTCRKEIMLFSLTIDPIDLSQEG
jgi:hypothetical protein